MASQTEFERGFIAGVNAMRIRALQVVINATAPNVSIDQEKEE
jgi:hypothetical protein